MLRETCRLLPCWLALGACSGAHDKPTPAPPPAPSAGSVELGTPGGDDGITFVPFEPGQVLRLQTFGQGGTHVLLAARTQGFGIRAFAAFTLTDLNTGNQLLAPEPARPQLFFCHDDVCDLVPVTIMAGGLTTPDEEREGLPIEITVDVRDDTTDLTASASENAVLSTADLGLDAGL